MKDVSIKTKLLFLVILSIFIVSATLITSSIIFINHISELNIVKHEKESYKTKELELKDHVQSVINAINGISNNPTFASLDEKQNIAKDVVKNMTYGKDGYFWINDSNHVVVMHAVKPEINGKNMYESKDPNGVMIYQEIVKVANANVDGGLVKYGWSKPVRLMVFNQSFLM
ncbi:MAG: cache domain-containing protein [Aliarcobacter sp.]